MAKVSKSVAMAGESMKNIFLVGLFSVLFLGCASGHCKKGKGADMAASEKSNTKNDRVFVHKPDGSLQCQNKSGKSLDEMAKDLDGIIILSKQKKSDGMMRIQVCGAPTGNNNVYEINAADLQRALDVGFKVWKEPGE